LLLGFCELISPFFKHVIFFNFSDVVQAFYSLRAVRSGDRIPLAARFPTPVRFGLGADPASCTIVPGLFTSGKAVRAWRCPSNPISTEVKERI